jgi:hypothetical protein
MVPMELPLLEWNSVIANFKVNKREEESQIKAIKEYI